jgi:hypothetical protein
MPCETAVRDGDGVVVVRTVIQRTRCHIVGPHCLATASVAARWRGQGAGTGLATRRALEVFVKLRLLLIAVAGSVVMYSGLNVANAAAADSATCCENNGGCPDDYRCDYSQSCGTLPGQCIPQPVAESRAER